MGRGERGAASERQGARHAVPHSAVSVPDARSRLRLRARATEPSHWTPTGPRR